MKPDLIRAITQPFSGSNWPVNLLIGSGVFLLGALFGPYQQVGQLIQIVSQIFVVGYAAVVAQNTLASYRNNALPDWFSDWRNVGLLGMNTAFGIWAWLLVVSIITPLFEANLSGQIIVAVGATGYLIGAMLLKGLGLSVLALLIMHYIATNNIAALIQFNAVWDRVRANPLGVVVAAAVTMGALIVPSLALAYIPTMAGVFVYAVVKFASYLVVANVWAQVYKS